MSPAPSDALLGTKPESLLGTSPSKLSRQTGASHSVLVHSVNEDGTTQVGCLRFLCSVLEPTLGWRPHVLAASPPWASQACGAAAWGHVRAAICMKVCLWWGGRGCIAAVVGPFGLRDACACNPTLVVQVLQALDIEPQGDHPSVRIVIEQICCRPHVALPLGSRLCLTFLSALSCRWPGT